MGVLCLRRCTFLMFQLVAAFPLRCLPVCLFFLYCCCCPPPSPLLPSSLFVFVCVSFLFTFFQQNVHFRACHLFVAFLCVCSFGPTCITTSPHAASMPPPSPFFVLHVRITAYIYIYISIAFSFLCVSGAFTFQPFFTSRSLPSSYSLWFAFCRFSFSGS